jgi:DNA-binding SARP family transcriptional activator
MCSTTMQPPPPLQASLNSGQLMTSSAIDCLPIYAFARELPGQDHCLRARYAPRYACRCASVLREVRVTRFEILGRVAARQDDRAADLPPQQQLLLAVLVIAGGAVVGRRRLEEALWGAREPYPEHGVEKAAYELRRALRRASPEDDPVPAGDGGYRLLVTPEQADVLRFRAKTDAATHASGPESLERMREALREWGPGATGLHGGEPLLGLAGQWADNTRHKLRTDYRKAVLHCLAQGTSLQDYDFVLRQCEQLNDDVKALLDEEFTGLWMRAADAAGYPAKAREIYQRAAEAAARVGERPGPAPRSLDAQLRADRVRPETAPSAASPEPPTPPETVPAPPDSRTMTVTAYGGNAFGSMRDFYYYEGVGKQLPYPPSVAEDSGNDGGDAR